MALDINYSNIGLIDELYASWQADPMSVDPSWGRFFDGLGNASEATSKHVDVEKLRVFNLIQAYREYGHLIADINPLAKVPDQLPDELNPYKHGFTDEDFEREFPTFGLMAAKSAKLQEILAALKETYCEKIGIEYFDLQSRELESWLQARIEPNRCKVALPIEEKRMILEHLNKSSLLESFLHTKYVGQKRFSLEGAETLIPMLATLVEAAADAGASDVVLGMAHRGRLNVLSNILDKSYRDIFAEFEERDAPGEFLCSGDVKYHKGFFSAVKTVHGHDMTITLSPNPSHLEAVDAVVEGQARARQDNLPGGWKRVLPVLIHGDAALAGQGVVYEVLQMYRLPGYETGGTIHIVINNQIGFTTSPEEGRSTRYCTDIARAFGAPVFHVNAEDPEGCVFAVHLAFELRQIFHCDVFIDLNGYRKYGHNESDEPAFTQPVQAAAIKERPSIREIYRDHLIHQGVLERAMAESLEQDFKRHLGEALDAAKLPVEQGGAVQKSQDVTEFRHIETGVSKEVLHSIADAANRVPDGFSLHRKLDRLIEGRKSMGEGRELVDWGMGEQLAFGSLLWEGISLRLAGQDVGRGTFSHRHALFVDQVTDERYLPLAHLKENQGRFDLVNSLLSEYGALGFEYGYSLSAPTALVLWEAQFGDFSNGAQVVIDQFIATGEQKWRQSSSLTLLLPHGYEGQGPEHSSARIERFLSLAGCDNMRIVYPSTPAQFFHLLRRQALLPVKKPLVVFTPKALLRLPECRSALQEFESGTFLEILDDDVVKDRVKTVIFCTGKIYYELNRERKARARDDVAIVRIEQLYPLDERRLVEIRRSYGAVKRSLWVQEEPQNMGAWSFISSLVDGLEYVGRPQSASPAVGSHAAHDLQHEAIINSVFGERK